MRISVGVALSCAVLMLSEFGFASRRPPCTFNISPDRESPEILGEVAGRAWVMAQPDSPLAIVRMDLRGVKLNAGSGWFNESGRYIADVKNVSDHVLTDARVTVRVGFGLQSGVGSGIKAGRPLQPGEQTRIEWKSGGGNGTGATTDEVSIVALVDEVKTAECTYKPSQAWPSGGKPTKSTAEK